MGLKFKPKFKVTDIRKAIADDINRLEKNIEDRFLIIGDEFVIFARSQGKPPGFGDITGNLRSSIGYILFKDGKPIYDDFQESAKGTDRATGTQTGYDVAMESIDIPEKGYCLVCVAGMEYAAAVESNGYDVITGGTVYAEKLLRETIAQLKSRLK